MQDLGFVKKVSISKNKIILENGRGNQKKLIDLYNKIKQEYEILKLKSKNKSKYPTPSKIPNRGLEFVKKKFEIFK